MKYNEAHATTMLNALIGTETLKKHDSELLDKVWKKQYPSMKIFWIWQS